MLSSSFTNRIGKTNTNLWEEKPKHYRMECAPAKPRLFKTGGMGGETGTKGEMKYGKIILDGGGAGGGRGLKGTVSNSIGR